MRFAHLADCHLGGWREQKIRDIGLESFRRAVDICIERNVDFVLICGDLFDSAMPDIECLKSAVRGLLKLKERDIPVYIIAGSHDFSASGKTMLDVLETAKLARNVMAVENNKISFVEDKKTGARIAGIYGKKGGLEKKSYEEIDFSGLNVNEGGFKVFMFHTALEEFKPEEIKEEGLSVAKLPEGFDYYAGGHVHYILGREYSSGIVEFPGALFPNNFRELEEFGYGTFNLVEAENGQLHVDNIKLKIKQTVPIYVDVEGKSPNEAMRMLMDSVKQTDIKDKIVLLRVSGILSEGKTSDVDFRQIESGDAYCMLRNTGQLNVKPSESIEVRQGTAEEIEAHMIGELKDKIFGAGEIMHLMALLDKEKCEGETNPDFERRIIGEVGELLKEYDIK